MIQSNHLQLFNSSGFGVILNNRRGAVTPPDDTPTQEEVVLLNIKDRTGTYTGKDLFFDWHRFVSLSILNYPWKC